MQFSRLTLKHQNTKIPSQLAQQQFVAPVIDNVPKVPSLIRGMRFASLYPKSTNYHYCDNHATAVTSLLLQEILWHRLKAGIGTHALIQVGPGAAHYGV